MSGFEAAQQISSPAKQQAGLCHFAREGDNLLYSPLYFGCTCHSPSDFCSEDGHVNFASLRLANAVLCKGHVGFRYITRTVIDRNTNWRQWIIFYDPPPCLTYPLRSHGLQNVNRCGRHIVSLCYQQYTPVFTFRQSIFRNIKYFGNIANRAFFALGSLLIFGLHYAQLAISRSCVI